MQQTYKPSLDEIREMATRGNVIPVHREIPADLETPVSVYLKLCARTTGPSFLLESVEKGEIVGRYSFIGLHAPMSAVSYGDRTIIGAAGGVILEECQGDPLDVAKGVLADRHAVNVRGLPSLTGGAVGYFAYDIVRFMERLPATAERKLDIPDMALLFADNLVVFDHVRHRLIVIANMRVESDLRASFADAVARIDQMVADLRCPLTPPVTATIQNNAKWESNFTQEQFESKVRKAKEYITAGDIFQVVISQRLSRRTDADPFTIYRALRMVNPSPYMFYLDFTGIAGIEGPPVRLIGSSPEMHVRLEDGTAFLHPIAGTRW